MTFAQSASAKFCILDFYRHAELELNAASDVLHFIHDKLKAQGETYDYIIIIIKSGSDKIKICALDYEGVSNPSPPDEAVDCVSHYCKRMGYKTETNGIIH